MRIFNIIRNKIFLLTAFSYLLLPQILLAESQGTSPSPSGGGEGLKPPTNIQSIPALLTAILEFVVEVGTYIVPLAIIFAGFKFVEARGNPEKLVTARSMLLYVLIGGAISLGAQVLKTVITGTVEGIQGT